MDRMDSDGGGGAKDANRRPHWRRRDPSATAVYVVHPTQFRSVVQQLTGAPPAVTTHQHSSASAAAAAASANAAAQQRGGDEHSSNKSNRRTLGQMHQECMAWADSADYY